MNPTGPTRHFGWLSIQLILRLHVSGTATSQPRELRHALCAF